MGERHASTLEWRQIARGPRPLYHVLTWPGIEDWTPDDFYAVGESDWQDFRSHWIHYAGELRGTCLEIGCGAGRISRQLGGEFDRVQAVDVSADMIAKARAAAPDNVEFHQVDGVRLPFPPESMDAVFSVHVLQHLDDFEDVSAYVAEAERVLMPGGTMMLHIAISSDRERLLGRRGVLKRELRLWRARRALRRGREHTAVRYREYRWEDVQRLLFRLGLERVELRLIPVRSNGYHHSFWLATKPE
ncbi:MAG TPA: class I SAM-dependent methyltransferase [Thermoleophilaceae bacterium]|nr:class I SAM-dependent methyltransferase [Thermoleophilaceae bacterium]